jgi:hypothetical protein
VFADEPFELRDELVVATGSKVVVDAILEHCEPLFLEAAARIIDEPLFGETEQRRSPPERERLFTTTFLRKGLESPQVELVLVDTQHVARISRHETAVTKLPAEMGDRVLEDLRGGRWWSLVPERVDQPSARDDLVGRKQEVDEERLFLAATNWDRPSVVDDLQRTKDAELHSGASI